VFVVMVAPECAPVAQAGGLGDVVCGLSRELELRGNAVEIVLPKYDCLRYDRIHGLTVAYEDLWVPWYSAAVHCTVFFGFVEGRKCFFIEPHSADRFFDRGHLYGSDDDASRFAFFCKAALEFMLKADKRPEIIHCHDWQTALVPVLLFEIYQQIGMGGQRVCFTAHNFGHQGITGESILWATGLCNPARYFAYERLRDNFNPAALNLMKAGIVYSNFVTTVSRGHAWEVCHCDEGRGLGHTLHVHRDKFGGVLNGVDYEVWNPEIDPRIPHRYGPDSIDDKYLNKHALRDRFMLRHEYKPVVAYVGRLDNQKGVHLIHHAIFYALDRGAQFVLLGSSPDPAINGHFWHLKHYLNDHPDVHLELQFCPELAHLVLRRIRPTRDAQHVRALRAGAINRAEVRHGPDRPGSRGIGRHDRRPRLRLGSAGPAHRIRLSPQRPPGAGVRDDARDRALARLPAGLPLPDAQRHAHRPLVGTPGPGLPQHLRPHQAQVTDNTDLGRLLALSGSPEQRTRIDQRQ